jgi:hypothetical protein
MRGAGEQFIVCLVSGTKFAATHQSQESSLSSQIVHAPIMRPLHGLASLRCLQAREADRVAPSALVVGVGQTQYGECWLRITARLMIFPSRMLK